MMTMMQRIDVESPSCWLEHPVPDFGSANVAKKEMQKG
jgi:hypothetical protein